MKKTRIILVDDHLLFRKSLISLINTISDKITVVSDFSNGIDLLKWLQINKEVDLIIIDINMKQMNGFDLAQTLNQEFTSLPVLVLSMLDDELTIIRMLKFGVKGYLTKNVDLIDIEKATEDILNEGFHFSENVKGGMVMAINDKSKFPILELNKKEIQFLTLACSELTYKEIADKMNMSVKTVDSYRAILFEKFNVKSRVGLVIYALKFYFK